MSAQHCAGHCGGGRQNERPNQSPSEEPSTAGEMPAVLHADTDASAQGAGSVECGGGGPEGSGRLGPDREGWEPLAGGGEWSLREKG